MDPKDAHALLLGLCFKIAEKKTENDALHYNIKDMNDQIS